MQVRRVGAHQRVWQVWLGRAMAALGCVALLLTSACAEATGAPSQANASAALQTVTLNESSPFGPALWSVGTQRVAAGTPRALLAWTGTDRYHHINVMSSYDGVSFGQKRMLPASAYGSPAIVAPPCMCNIVVAWTGLDARHSLNVLVDAFGAQRILTLDDASPYSPSITYFGDQFWLAWTGSDPEHSLNVRSLGSQGLTPGPKTIVPEAHAATAPTLTVDLRFQMLLLTWAEQPPAGSPAYVQPALTLKGSRDGVGWQPILAAPLRQTSFRQPTLLAIGAPPSVMPYYYFLWTGTDPLHSLNLATSYNYDNWSGTPMTLAEQSRGGAVVGFTGHPNEILLAWTGIDPACHLNVATMHV